MGRDLKVLIVSYNFWPEAFRINDLAIALTRLGCRVTVLTGQPNCPSGVIFPGYRAISIRRDRHPAGIDVVRMPSFPPRRGRALDLLGNYFASIVNMAVVGPWLLRGQKNDVVFLYATSPVLHALSGWVVAKCQRAKSVTWVQDLWPDSLEATGFIRNQSFLRFVGRFVKFAYRSSDLILAQSESFAQTVRRTAGGTPVRYFPNPGEGVFSAELPPGEPFTLELKPGFNVVFASNLGTVQSLGTILDAAEMLLDRADIRFVVVGSGSRLNWLTQQVRGRNLVNMELLGRLPASAMPSLFRQSSALIVSLIASPIMVQTIPSKLQTYFWLLVNPLSRRWMARARG